MQRFWDKIDKSQGCWTWLGALNDSGYGVFRHKDKIIKAHRFAFELVMGKIPNGLEIDHLCSNTLCVNPYHLVLATKSENLKRKTGMKYKLQTHCRSGHELNEKNTYLRPDGYRDCRICDKLRQRVYQSN